VLRVVVESPFAGKSWRERRRNLRYVRACMRYVLLRDCAPFASHALYTQPGVLDDDDPRERRTGIEAGLAFVRSADETWVFKDFGVSSGMQQGIQRANLDGRPVRYVTLAQVAPVALWAVRHPWAAWALRAAVRLVGFFADLIGRCGR